MQIIISPSNYWAWLTNTSNPEIYAVWACIVVGGGALGFFLVGGIIWVFCTILGTISKLTTKWIPRWFRKIRRAVHPKAHHSDDGMELGDMPITEPLPAYTRSESRRNIHEEIEAMQARNELEASRAQSGPRAFRPREGAGKRGFWRTRRPGSALPAVRECPSEDDLEAGRKGDEEISSSDGQEQGSNGDGRGPPEYSA